MIIAYGDGVQGGEIDGLGRLGDEQGSCGGACVAGFGHGGDHVIATGINRHVLHAFQSIVGERVGFLGAGGDTHRLRRAIVGLVEITQGDRDGEPIHGQADASRGVAKAVAGAACGIGKSDRIKVRADRERIGI